MAKEFLYILNKNKKSNDKKKCNMPREELIPIPQKKNFCKMSKKKD